MTAFVDLSTSHTNCQELECKKCQETFQNGWKLLKIAVNVGGAIAVLSSTIKLTGKMTVNQAAEEIAQQIISQIPVTKK